MAQPAEASAELWARVDRYIAEKLSPLDAALESALASSAAAGLPSIQVSTNQGKLLMLLARLVRAQRILEIGTLGGFSTIWLARGLNAAAGARVITLESEPRHADVARTNFARAGLSHLIELRLGPALESLPKLSADGPFDLIFIDADKPRIPRYVDWAVRLSRPGSVIVVDNVVREGRVTDAGDDDPSVQGVRQMFERLSSDGRVAATAVQTVGSKGYDGFAIAIVS